MTVIVDKNQDKDHAHRNRQRGRTIQQFAPGSSTAVPTNVMYRLGKLRDLNLLTGEWLDCGCANGGYTTFLVNLGVEKAVGIDTQEKRIVKAREQEKAHPSISFICASAEFLPFSEASFDGVLLNEVLEHITDELKALKEIYRVLRPGGYLIVMSPNRWFPFEGHGMQIGRHIINFPVPILPWIPNKIAYRFMRARNYWPHELREMIHIGGFVIHTAGFVWPMFEVFPWLPKWIIRRYRNLVPTLENIPFIQRFGVSNFIVAQKP